MMSNNELKCCPFCGEKGQLKSSSWAGIVNHYWIGCYEQTCPIKPETKTYTVRDEAIAAWNKRAEEVNHD
jgi:hypothetical protein